MKAFTAVRGLEGSGRGEVSAVRSLKSSQLALSVSQRGGDLCSLLEDISDVMSIG